MRPASMQKVTASANRAQTGRVTCEACCESGLLPEKWHPGGDEGVWCGGCR